MPAALALRTSRSGPLGLRRRGGVAIADADRVTVGLAALAFLTAGGVAVGEFARRLRRRLAREETLHHGHPAGAAESIQLAGRATQDTLKVALEGYTHASRQETVLVNLLSGFVFSFALARLSTVGMRSGWWPFRTVSIGGRHIHHFVPGILLAFGSGIAALITDDLGTESALAAPFGAGIGLTFDEAALLLDLRDVYWSREGLLSVQASLATSALLGGTILVLRMLRRGERLGEQQGLIPDAEGEISPPPPPLAVADAQSARTA